jgi:anhydro-N-acetylmuramic acid kinase
VNQQIRRLYELAGQESRLIIGLMSGTSLDGLDVALCVCTGSGARTKVELRKFETMPYDASFRHAVKKVFSRKDADLELVTLLNPWIGMQHAHIILLLLQKWGYSPGDIDLVASHGQTIYHAPKRLHDHDLYDNATLQIGDGDHLAVETGIITISDFRQKHIAAGGEGAPLAAYGDYLIFSKEGENRVMLNMGGIANFTWLPGSLDAGEVYSTDTGTGNTLMDQWMQLHFPGKYFDENATVALQGICNAALLKALKQHSFFQQSLPKTTGPELFNIAYLQQAQETSGTQQLSAADVMATLNRFSAETIAEAIMPLHQQYENCVIYASGGGMHNPVLMQSIQELLPGITIKDTHSLGIHPDAKEAVLFAVLANECVSGGQVTLGDGRNGIPTVTMGKISLPG